METEFVGKVTKRIALFQLAQAKDEVKALMIKNEDEKAYRDLMAFAKIGAHKMGWMVYDIQITSVITVKQPHFLDITKHAKVTKIDIPEEVL